MAKRRGKTKQQLTPKQMAALLVLCVIAAAVQWYLRPETVSLEDIPEWSGAAYVELEDNQPGFTKEEMTLEAFEDYSELDYLGRSVSVMGTAFIRDPEPEPELTFLETINAMGIPTWALFAAIGGLVLFIIILVSVIMLVRRGKKNFMKIVMGQ